MDGSLIIPMMVTAYGCLVADLIFGRRQPTAGLRVAAALAWGPGLAAGVLSLGIFAGYASGLGQLGRGGLAVIGLAVAVVALPASRRAHRPISPGSRSRWPDRVGWVALACLAAGYVWCFLRWLEDRPLGSYDAMGIWTYRALQIFRSGDAFPDTIRLLAESKPDYPLLVPGLVATQFVLWGGESIVIAVATGWLFLIGLGAMTYLAVERHAGSGVALASVALLLSTPMVFRWAFAQSADLALGYFTLGAAVGLVDAVARGHPQAVPPVVTGFFLGLMVWTKNEGTLLALILAAAFVAAALLWRVRVPIRWWVLTAVGAFPGAVANAVFKHGWVSVSEIDRYLRPEAWSLLLDPARWQTVGTALAGRLVPWSEGAVWGGTLWLLIGLAVAGRIRGSSRPEQRVAGLVGLCCLVALGCDAALYMITPDPLEWHLRTSLDRLLLQILPLLVVAVVSASLSHPSQRPALEGD